MRRLVTTAVVGLAVVVGSAGPASAHVILDRFEVEVGSVVDLEFRAPIERQGVTNQKLYALVPGPLAVTRCSGPSAAWRCSLDTTSRPGDTYMTWETPVAGSPQDLRFAFTVRVPASAPLQEHKLPVVQTYSDGEAVRWIDDGEPTPAPRLAVVAVGKATAAPAPTAASHSAKPAPGSSSAAPSGAGATSQPPTARAGASGSAAPVAPGPVTSAGGGVSAGSIPTAAAEELIGIDTDPGPSAQSGAGDGGGMPAVAVVGGALVLLATLAGGAVVLRQRRAA